MDESVRAAVRDRAKHCCEYCRLAQADSPLIPLQIEHIVPRKHGGADELENLALACAECNLRKGPDLTGIDPQTNRITRLFDPRRDRWSRHFKWQALHIVGKTAVGRTTVRVLELNSAARLRVRLATGWSCTASRP